MSKPKWVIMVYIAADDTLANFAIESLKQLKETATDKVVVAAQFDPDGLSKAHRVRRYVFNLATRNKPLEDDNEHWGDADSRDVDMAKPETLTAFMNWVYHSDDAHKYHLNDADKYCLILWGHGPELLFQLPVRSDRQILPSDARSYFTPGELREALKATHGKGKKLEVIKDKRTKLDIIAIDACSMSMCEIAYELKDAAQFLVASQEEVPDKSFPYDTLVERFSQDLGVRKLCQDGVVGYVKAYQQYFYNQSTGTHPVTLAAIDLKQVNALKEPLQKFATELLSKASNPDIAKAIYDARTESQGYVGGLFVDLHDFCDNLGKKLPILQSICGNVSRAIDRAVTARAGVVDGRVVEVVDDGVRPLTGDRDVRCEKRVNGRVVKSANPNLLSHGLSIYFPYLKDGKEREYIEQDLVKGIPRMVDKDSELAAGYNALNALSIRIRHSVRRQMIGDIESNYPALQFELATGWYKFIQQGWSRILAQRILADQEPGDLDRRYMAEQCIKNLLTVIDNCGSLTGETIVEKSLEARAIPPQKANGHSSTRVRRL